MTPFFIILNDAPKSYGANRKNASKKMFFDEDMDFWKLAIFDGPKK